MLHESKALNMGIAGVEPHHPSTTVLCQPQGSKTDVVARERKRSKAKYANKLDTNVVLSHPSNASQLKEVDAEYPTFKEDPKNIRLGVSIVSINLFGSQNSTHSTWPMFVWIYNLPPWLCMRKKYIHMRMLIQGRKQPGIDINLYL
jgi:hypothetical protein